MPVHDPEKREIARAVLLQVTICRKCYARNPIKAKKCRRCRSTRLRRKKTEKSIKSGHHPKARKEAPAKLDWD